MCWNFQVSSLSWVIGITVGTYLLYRNRNNDRVYGMLILSYSWVQFGEAIMWLSVDYDCKHSRSILVHPRLNMIGTWIVLISLWSVTSGVGVGIAITYHTWIPAIIGLTITIGGLIYTSMYEPITHSLTSSPSTPHLEWGFDLMFYIPLCIVCIMLVWYYVVPTSSWLLISLFYITTIITSSIPYKGKATGTLWCWSSAIFAPIIPFISL